MIVSLVHKKKGVDCYTNESFTFPGIFSKLTSKFCRYCLHIVFVDAKTFAIVQNVFVMF